MSDRLSHYQVESVVKHISWIFDEYDRIRALPHCYQCKKSGNCGGNCEYEPQQGESERINCPLFQRNGTRYD